MQYSALTLLALSASAFAAPQASSSVDLVSVLSVLQTALPSSLVAEALTNSDAVSSEIASEFSHSETPTWFTNLPSDIQTYLNPVITGGSTAASALSSVLSNATGIVTSPVVNATAVSNTTLVGSAQSSILASIHSANASAIAANGTKAAGTSKTTAKTTSSVSDSSSSSSGATAASGASATSDSSSTSTSKAGASVPTALYGMGLAGAVGLVGLFAL